MKDSEDLKKAVESLGGEFELIRELGRGATAVVYLLRDHALDRDLAMKVIRTALSGDEEGLARLQREARLVAQLMHPNIVKLFGTHRLSDGSLALLMEHVPGRNLKEVLRQEGALSIPNTIKVLKDIGSALAYAHRRRIVHRDVKPENIYIDEEVGAARLADFGVARSWDQDARLTVPGASLGTPAYMSPEQIDGKNVDGRTDVYSLGLVGYEMLLGHHPWEGENVFTIIFRQKNEELPIEPLGLADAPALARTLEKALAKDPGGRPESAEAFLQELSEEGVRPRPTSSRTNFGVGIATGTGQAPGHADVEGVLAPVDWSTVEPAEGQAQSVAHESSSDAEAGPSIPPSQPLGVRPKRRWGPILGMSAAVVAAGSFGVYQLLPLGVGASDPGDFAPIQTSTSPPAPEERPQPEDLIAGPPPGLVMAAGTPTEGLVGSLIELRAQVRGDGGLPLVDTLVLFQVEEGAGSVGSPEARTDAEGMVVVEVLLPDSPSVTLVLGRVAGAEGLEARFELTSHPGPPQNLTPLGGDQQDGFPGEPLPDFLGVRIEDEFGNPLPEIQVRFEVLQGGGQVGPELIRTDGVGRAFTRWTLGSSEGTQWVTASIPDVEGALFTFQATAGAVPQPEPEEAVEEVAEPDSLPPAPPAPDPVVVVARTFAVGGSHVCHISGGRTSCRGANDRGQGGEGSLGGLIGMTAGVSHGCGLNAEGEAWCWGANESGQLGDGTTMDSRSGAVVDTETRFSVLAAGLSHTCGLGPGGVASCWGRNVGGQLGDGSRADHIRPGPVGGSRSFHDIVAGWNHSCGLVAGDRAFCWGSNSEGQLGDGFRVDRLVPTPVPGNFRALAAGANHTCGIRGDDVFCWGDNSFGQLGDGTTDSRLSPVRVTDLPSPPLVLATGAVHTCALLRDRSAFCWGQNLHGQLGNGTTENQSTPVRVSGDLEFITIFAGGGVTCGFAQDGSEYCWGFNQSGQLGDGSRTNRSSPVAVRRNVP